MYLKDSSKQNKNQCRWSVYFQYSIAVSESNLLGCIPCTVDIAGDFNAPTPCASEKLIDWIRAHVERGWPAILITTLKLSKCILTHPLVTKPNANCMSLSYNGNHTHLGRCLPQGNASVVWQQRWVNLWQSRTTMIKGWRDHRDRCVKEGGSWLLG